MYIIYKRPTLDLKNTEAESVKSTQVKRQKKDILWKQEPKESRGGHTNSTEQTLGQKLSQKPKEYYIMKERSAPRKI